ncbi:MAG: zinc-ribbon domain containing protein [Clostridia bacterium]|nr:zinc-ribbon domain containing protein [Clostridia bacterium]MBQ6162901.1 zinc-ribbon domain containing protein [Clostridia bacterium]MBR5426807.1 zinc-ribbon domain containing protein [Clostridia bacterium]
MYEDKTLICKECGNEFIFTAGEQEFYAEKGFENEPQRCKACRDARKAANRSGREMIEVTCSKCGKTCQIPASLRNKPDPLCSDCFAASKAE